MVKTNETLSLKIARKPFQRKQYLRAILQNKLEFARKRRIENSRPREKYLSSPGRKRSCHTWKTTCYSEQQGSGCARRQVVGPE